MLSLTFATPVLPSADNDEYEVVNFEDEVDKDTFSVNEHDEDKETSE